MAQAGMGSLERLLTPALVCEGVQAALQRWMDENPDALERAGGGELKITWVAEPLLGATRIKVSTTLYYPDAATNGARGG